MKRGHHIASLVPEPAAGASDRQRSSPDRPTTAAPGNSPGFRKSFSPTFRGSPRLVHKKRQKRGKQEGHSRFSVV